VWEWEDSGLILVQCVVTGDGAVGKVNTAVPIPTGAKGLAY
jgi:hypothetical protein